MPVTAKLSRNFYERLGDDIAGELVDWFNAVDSTYQNQLRELNDLNWERFKAVYRADMTEFRSEVAASLADIRTEMANLRADMMKWMFIYWSGSIITLGGLMFALLRVR